MLEKFKNKEDYEICTAITKIIEQWSPININKKIKIKNKTHKENNNE